MQEENKDEFFLPEDENVGNLVEEIKIMDDDTFSKVVAQLKSIMTESIPVPKINPNRRERRLMNKQVKKISKKYAKLFNKANLQPEEDIAGDLKPKEDTHE